MVREILIVSTDHQLYQRIETACKQISNGNYSFVYIPNTKAAADHLREHSTALVLMDRLPERESITALLFYIWNAFPDIPILNMSGGHEFPESLTNEEKEITIPTADKLPFSEWPAKINSVLVREQEGGRISIKDVQNFVQMIQNELRTCTLRITDYTDSRLGILFFEKGKLKNARLETVQGEVAARELISWENVKIRIQDSCNIAMTKIDSNLQTRLKTSQVKKDNENKTVSSPAWIDAVQEEKRIYQELIDHTIVSRIYEKESEKIEYKTTSESGIARFIHRPMTTGTAIVLTLFLLVIHELGPYLKELYFNQSLPSRQTITMPVPVIEPKPPPDKLFQERTKKQEGFNNKMLESLSDDGPIEKDMPKQIPSTQEMLSAGEETPSKATQKERLITVYLHYSNPGNHHLAYQLADHLMKGSFFVPKIELVKNTQNAIRYFHTADHGVAMDLNMQVIDFLKESFPDKDTINLKMKNLAKIYPMVPRGQMEIWLNLPPQ